MGGWSIWEEATWQLCEFENFYVDCSSSLYALTPEKAKELIMAYGTKRVLFGTDYPMWSYENEIDYLLSLGLDTEEIKSILNINAKKVFNLE